MKKILKRFISITMVVLMIVAGSLGSFHSFSASANEIAPVPNSNFRYSVVTKEISRNGNQDNIELLISCYNNPGIRWIQFKVAVPDGCEITETKHYNTHGIASDLISGNLALAGFLTTTPTTENFQFGIFITIDDVKKDNVITVGLDSYTCDSEGISIPGTITTPDNPPPVDETIPVDPDKQVMALLGDANDDGSINSNDAYIAMMAWDTFGVLLPGDSFKRITVSALNGLRNTSKYKQTIPSLKYAEVIDVDFDNLITEEDYKAILLYSSQLAVNSPEIMDSAIGKFIYINV